MTEHAQRTEKNGVITITFDRQEKLNATSREMLEVLERAIYD
ncbi:MAG: enoyl-CoA hydratase/isomerase family protein, partial [Actinobacteria bacterium]|nr:enoyl-CoA hydratase/isomerase family protein [Actinomycetota bacterium]